MKTGSRLLPGGPLLPASPPTGGALDLWSPNPLCFEIKRKWTGSVLSHPQPPRANLTPTCLIGGGGAERRTVGGRAPHPVISLGKCSQTKSLEDAQPSAAGRAAVWPVRLRVTWGGGCLEGRRESPEMNQARRGLPRPPTSQRGRGDSTVFPVLTPSVRASSSVALESCPCFQGVLCK